MPLGSGSQWNSERAVPAHCKSKVLRITLAGMARNAGDAVTCAGGCKIISDAALGQVSSLREIVSCGGVGSVLDALKQHGAHEGLCHSACAALANMSTHADTRERVGNANAVQAISKALRAHRGSAPVQHAGLTAMGNLALHSDQQRLLLDAHGLILHSQEALARHPADPAVCEAALSALASFFVDASCQPLLSPDKSPLISLAVSAMRAHRECRDVCYAAIAMLVNLSWCEQVILAMCA